MITHPTHDLKRPPTWARLLGLIATVVIFQFLAHLVIGLFRTGHVVISLLAGAFIVVGTLVMVNFFKIHSLDGSPKLVTRLGKFWPIILVFQLLLAGIVFLKIPVALRTAGYGLVDQAMTTENFNQSLSLLKDAKFLGANVLAELSEELMLTLNTLNFEMDKKAVYLAQLYAEIASDDARRNQIFLIRTNIEQGKESLDTNQANRVKQVIEILDPDSGV